MGFVGEKDTSAVMKRIFLTMCNQFTLKENIYVDLWKDKNINMSR